MSPGALLPPPLGPKHASRRGNGNTHRLHPPGRHYFLVVSTFRTRVPQGRNRNTRQRGTEEACLLRPGRHVQGESPSSRNSPLTALGTDGAFRVQIFPYPCVRLCRFGEVAINPFYPRALELVKNRPDAIFLDLACCSTY